MIYVFLIAASLCSHYMIASEKEQQDQLSKKAHYNKIISEIKDDKERAKYEEGYIVVDDNFIMPYSEIPVSVPVGKEGNFMTLPYHQAMLFNGAMNATLNQRQYKDVTNQ